MNQQQVFDKSAAHMMKQFAQSKLTDPQRVIDDPSYKGSCSYYGDDGMKDGIGCLISDENYSPNLEGYYASSVRVIKALFASGVAVHKADMRMITELQRIHDYKQPTSWFQQLQRLAHEFKLDDTMLITTAVEYGRIAE